MKWKEALLFWLIGLGLLVGFLILIKSILLPFVVAIIVAYFLDPVADRLEDAGFSRLMATLTIVTLFFVMVALLVGLLAPIMVEQFMSLIEKLPSYSLWLHDKAEPLLNKFLGTLNPESLDDTKAAFGNLSGEVMTFMTKMLTGLLQSTLAVVNVVLLVFITPIVTVYCLYDWDVMVAKINSWLPPAYAPTVREQAKLVDRALSGYIRGQTNVCLLLGTFYGVALTLVGLDFGLFIGLGSGILTFIPYVGIFFGLLVGLTVAFFQFGDVFHVGMVAGIFAVGQFIEGNFVTPKLVGDKVGLHPVWIIFGMLVGAALFGFVGILLAVPVTAIIGVLARFALGKYLQSPFYYYGYAPPVPPATLPEQKL